MGWLENKLAELPPVSKETKRVLEEIVQRKLGEMSSEIYDSDSFDNAEQRDAIEGAIMEGVLEATTLVERLKVEKKMKRFTYTVTFESDEEHGRTLLDGMGTDYAQRVNRFRQSRYPVVCVDEDAKEEEV